MPEFKKNTSPAMKRSGFKMKYQGGHSAFPFKSPLKDEDTGDEKIEKEELEEETEEEIAIEQIKPF